MKNKEEIIEFLDRVGVKAILVNHDDFGFSRKIKFTIYGIDYYITWFSNQSTLSIGDNKRAAQIPFKYIGLDDTYPLVDGNRSIEFSYEYPFPYHTFRIPLEIKEVKSE